MKKINFAFLSISALLITACGGSDSNNNAPTPNNNVTTPAVPNTPPAATKAAYQGSAFILPAGSTTASAGATNIGSDNLAILNADGKQIGLQVPGIYSGGMTILPGGAKINGKSYERFFVSGSKYANSKFGYITDGSNYIFSQGAPTTNMPTSGRVKYDGDAVVAHNNMVTIGDADFVADFAQRTLNGKISKEDESTFRFAPVYINAAISGNQFSSAGNTPVRSQGHFYGPNAAELGGVFHDSQQDISGSFGARIDY